MRATWPALTACSMARHGVTQSSRSGRLTITAGHSPVTRTGIRIDPGTLRTGDSFTITLDVAATTAITVAWFLVN